MQYHQVQIFTRNIAKISRKASRLSSPMSSEKKSALDVGMNVMDLLNGKKERS